MKKVISILLVALMLLGTLALVSCQKPDEDNTPDTPAAEETLKFGFGFVTSASATDATAEEAGAGSVTTTLAVVLVDKDGKIVKSLLDCADYSVSYNADGTTLANEEFKTKREQGDNYGMSAIGKTEWYKQADAFSKSAEGKTVAEVKALVAADYKGTADVQAAGCTIYVSDFAKAIEAAVANAVASDATASSTLKLGASTTQTPTNATAEADGSNELETTFFAAALDKDGKIVAAKSDCLAVAFTFDATGKSTFDATAELLTKGQLGNNYGMSAAGKTEWYKQAAAFDSKCIGKKPSEVASLMGSDYKGTADVQTAGCTIYVSGFVKAATKIG
ncbi:MAG: hypothetical protein J6S10_02085 [Clostridia bacterium]|nr:hypothetical protein [Clostridia bacterium]MBO7250405.1 hypothetical protein [Clostridia bacterium]